MIENSLGKMALVFAKNDLEPGGEMLRLGFHLVGQFGHRNPPNGFDFFAVQFKRTRVGSQDDVVKLVFGEAVVKFRSVNKVKGVPKVRQFCGVHSQLFAKTAGCGLEVRFAFTLVAAAGIGPEQRRVVLARRTLLKQGFSALIE
jgi:hypothetical protein